MNPVISGLSHCWSGVTAGASTSRPWESDISDCKSCYHHPPRARTTNKDHTSARQPLRCLRLWQSYLRTLKVSHHPNETSLQSYVANITAKCCASKRHTEGQTTTGPILPEWRWPSRGPTRSTEVPSTWNPTWSSPQHQWPRTTTLRYSPSTLAVSPSLLSTNHQLDSSSLITQIPWTITIYQCGHWRFQQPQHHLGI